MFNYPILIDGDLLPGDIQFLPPGVQVAHPTDASGNPVTVRFDVDESLALRIAGQVADLRELAAADGGDIPFIDFSHAGGAAAAEVTGAFWGGDDPKKGGVRLTVIWSALGAFAVLGRVYRRFSPHLHVLPDGSAIVGVGSLLGGLANRSAWTRIERIGGLDSPVGHSRAQEFQRLVRAAGAAGSPDPVGDVAKAEPDLFRAWFLLQPDAPMK